MKSFGGIEKETIHSTWSWKYLPERVGFALLLKDGRGADFTAWMGHVLQKPISRAGKHVEGNSHICWTGGNNDWKWESLEEREPRKHLNGCKDSGLKGHMSRLFAKAAPHFISSFSLLGCMVYSFSELVLRVCYARFCGRTYPFIVP